MALLTAGLLLGACTSPPKGAAPAAAPAAPPVLDPSYDWHVLVVNPFGSALQDIHFTLHEVLLFHDAAHAGDEARTDEAECYAIEGTSPQFLVHSTSAYLLCFRHDRLAHIEASVTLPTAQAAKIFADACSFWLNNSATPASPAPVTAADAPADSCSGKQGAVSYSARLEAGDAGATLSIELNAADAALVR